MKEVSLMLLWKDFPVCTACVGNGEVYYLDIWKMIFTVSRQERKANWVCKRNPEILSK